jgi:very-short-patch-repair endonuclease
MKHRCPCKYNKTQNKLRTILEDLFPYYLIKYNFKGFSWLKMKSGRRQEIDIYIPDLKLAIEYDGPQHFISIKHFGGKKQLSIQKMRDRNKNRKIKAHANDVKIFIRIPYTEPINKKNIIRILSNNGIRLKLGEDNDI